MITIEHEFYIRFILLLLQVGTDLLREIIKKALGKRKETLNQFLNSFRPAILNDKTLSQTQKDTLYPQNAQGASIDDFDITLLSHQINNYLDKVIDPLEMDATNEIRQLRNSYNAHTTEAKMDPKTFTKEWTKLVKIIIKVDTGMLSEVGKRHGDMIDHIENDSIDIMVLVQEIKKLDMTRVFFENIEHLIKVVQEDLKEINKGQKDITKNQGEIKEGQEQLTGKVESIKSTVQSTADTVASVDTNIKEIKAELLAMKEKAEQQQKVLEKQGKMLEHQTKLLETTIKILAMAKFSPDDQETKDMVTASLNEACKNYNANEPPTNAVQEKVFKLCKSVENMDVKLEHISSGSIIFDFYCFSLTSILELIDYIYSPSFQEHLDDIAEALADVTEKPINIKALGINEQSLRAAITDLKEKEYETVLQFELSCRGIDGLLHVLEVFEEGTAANSLNELSEALSEAVGKTIKLHTSIDVVQMKKAIQKIKDQLEAEDSQNSSGSLNVSKLGSCQKPLLYNIHQQLKSWGNHEFQTKMDSAGALHGEHLEEQASASSVHTQTNVVEDIKLKYNSNWDNDYDITSCALLTPDKLILADEGSRKLVVVNIPTGSEVMKMNLKEEPFDIAVLPKDQAAVTLPLGNNILIICTTNLSTIRNIPVHVYPSGITYNHDKLYVIYKPSFSHRTFNGVLVLNKQGGHLRELKLDIRFPLLHSYIAVSKDEKSLYITSLRDQDVIQYSLQGKRIAKNVLLGPQGLALLDDGSLLVCCSTGIHHMSADLKQNHRLTWETPEANSICYDPENHLVYIGSRCSDIIRAFNLETITQLGEINLKDQDHIHQEAQLSSEPHNDGRNIKPNLQIQPEIMTQGALGGMVHSRWLTELSIKSSTREKIFNDVSLIYKEDIHLTDNDTICCFEVLSPNSFLLADVHNTLKVVDIHTGSVVTKTHMHNMPCGIAVLPNNQAAVTLHNDGMILILSTNDLEIIRTIPINTYPLAMTSHRHELYVICNSSYFDSFSVLVINLNREILSQRKIPLDKNDILSFRHKNDIAVSKDRQSLYITNWKGHAVIRYSLDGFLIGEYALQRMDKTRGLTILDDGSLLVCSKTGTIHHISADLKQGHILTYVDPGINSMGYDVYNQLVYISYRSSNIKVFSLEKKT